jgi:hypothetical protein
MTPRRELFDVGDHTTSRHSSVGVPGFASLARARGVD